MELGAYWALPPINLSAKEIRVLEFSETFFPLFDANSNMRCTFSSISLREQPPEYMIISHVPSPGGELARGLVIDGRPLRIPENFIEALKPLVKEGGFLGMRWPVRLWIEDVCVNRSSAEEVEYMRSLIPEVYAKVTYNVCYLETGDETISTFFKVSRLLLRHVDLSEPQGLASWEATFSSLYRYSQPGVNIPETLAEYCRLVTHFFEQPYWGRLRSLREYLSVATVGFIYGDATIRDHMLLKAAMLVLQQEEAVLPRNTLLESSVPSGPNRDAISAGMRSWRTLVQWELARQFIKLEPRRGTFVWQYLAQLAPRISTGDGPEMDDMYLPLLIGILDAGHSWPAPPKAVKRSENGDEYEDVPDYLVSFQSWLMTAYHLGGSSSVPIPWPPAALADLMHASRANMSKGPMFFLINAGIGLYGQKEGSRPSWVPDYDAVGRSPERVPSTFEIDVPWSQRRCGFQFRGRRLEVLGSMAGKLDIVQQVPKPGDIVELFDFLRELPDHAVGATHDNEGTIRRVKSILDALHLDRHDPSAHAAFHRFVGTLLLTPQEDSNILLSLLGILPSDKVKDKAGRVREALFPEPDRGVVDTYAHDWAAGSARRLAADRIEAVGRYYAMGRYYEDKHNGVRDVNRVGRSGWGLVPRGSEVGDAVWRVKGYGAAIILRDVGTGRCLVGPCGIDVEWLRHCRYYIEVRIS